METLYRDFSPKGVQFFYVYKTLAHPELNGYVQPVTLEERLMHVNEAQRTLGSEFTWICDSMSNDIKHALGNAPNSEFVIDPDGKIVRMRAWSNPKQLRADLEELVGPVDEPTQVSDLNMPKPPGGSNTGGRVVPRIEVPGRMQPVKLQTITGDTPFYVKLRAEVEEQVLRTGTGKMYLGFHLDPLYHVHWNNLEKPLHFEIKPPAGVTVSPNSGDGPKVQEATDTDPREFLVDVENANSQEPMELAVQYFACSDDSCKAVTQQYVIRLERDADAGSVMARGGGGRGPGLEPIGRAVAELGLTDEQKAKFDDLRKSQQERSRGRFQKMQQGEFDFEALRAARQKMNEELLQEMKPVLNEEQYQKFAKAIESAGPGGAGLFAGFGPPSGAGFPGRPSARPAVSRGGSDGPGGTRDSSERAAKQVEVSEQPRSSAAKSNGHRQERDEPDSAVEAWVRLLVERITDRHDLVRESAREAVLAIGRPALPMLKRLVEDDDPATAYAAKTLIDRIERGGPGSRAGN